MEFRDLNAQYQALKGGIDAGIARVLEHGRYIGGPEVAELEARLAAYVGARHCITCANGTDALQLALMAWGVGPGDAVFVPDFTFFASGEAPALLGAMPVFVDVDERTFNLDPAKLEEAVRFVEDGTDLAPRVVVAVDLFGLPADYTAIREVCERHRMLLLEDGAQGFGGSIGSRMACSFGDVSTTSFFPAKPLGCYGDGGAVFTNDDNLAELLRSLRIHGKSPVSKYDNIRIGINSRLDTVQAAVLQVKFEAFRQHELEDVNRAAELYTQYLGDIVKTPVIPEGFYSSWAQYTIILESREQRDRVQHALKEQGIPTMIYYPKPMHLQGAFEQLGGREGDFPVSERLCGQVLSLPLHPYLAEEDIKFVSNAIRSALER